ncbi:MAG: hypothetical protein IPJ82_21095 [Lewinellaceae bacterium]|nr:hypothetical protein [Lewinellaceae bacterium]
MLENLRDDERLRALCFPRPCQLQEYIKMITDTGFGTAEIRAKRALTGAGSRTTRQPELIFAKEWKSAPSKTPCSPTARVYLPAKRRFILNLTTISDDPKGQVLNQNQPLAVCATKPQGHWLQPGRSGYIYFTVHLVLRRRRLLLSALIGLHPPFQPVFPAQVIR